MYEHVMQQIDKAASSCDNISTCILYNLVLKLCIKELENCVYVKCGMVDCVRVKPFQDIHLKACTHASAQVSLIHMVLRNPMSLEGGHTPTRL